MKEICLSECVFHKVYVISNVSMQDCDLKYKLEKLGFLKNEKIEILRTNYSGCSYLVKLMGIHFAIDKKICDKVIVYDC